MINILSNLFGFTDLPHWGNSCRLMQVPWKRWTDLASDAQFFSVARWFCLLFLSVWLFWKRSRDQHGTTGNRNYFPTFHWCRFDHPDSSRDAWVNRYLGLGLDPVWCLGRGWRSHHQHRRVHGSALKNPWGHVLRWFPMCKKGHFRHFGSDLNRFDALLLHFLQIRVRLGVAQTNRDLRHAVERNTKIFCLHGKGFRLPSFHLIA